MQYITDTGRLAGHGLELRQEQVGVGMRRDLSVMQYVFI